MSFLYFIPDVVEKPSAEQLGALGLTERLAGGGMAFRPLTQGKGPSGGAGVIVCRPRKHNPGYYPERQEWRQVKSGDGAPAYWLGTWKDARPGPADLQREPLLDGHLVKLGDGNEWLVPVARLLPEALVHSPEDGWSTCRLEAYAWLWDIAETFWEEFAASVQESTTPADGERVAVKLSDASDMAARVLGANYRVGLPEISGLGLFRTDTPVDILLALCDWPTLRKKAEALAREGASTEPASASGSPA